MHKKIKDFPAQISDAINDTKSVSINLDKIHRVVIMGMGGSAIAGLIMKDISKPFTSSRPSQRLETFTQTSALTAESTMFAKSLIM